MSWYVMSMGSDLDVHTVTFDGNPFTEKGKHRDGRQLVPGTTAALTMEAHNTGRCVKKFIQILDIYVPSNLHRVVTEIFSTGNSMIFTFKSLWDTFSSLPMFSSAYPVLKPI